VDGRRWLAATAGLAVLALAPLAVAPPFVLNILVQACIWAVLAASWDLLSGYAGQISFGHAGFFAAGAYTAALGSLHVWDSAWLGLAAGGLAAAVLGAAVGVPALRLRGHYLAITTVGFSEILRLLATNSVDVTNGLFGLTGFGSFGFLPAEPLAQRRVQYALGVALVGLCGLAMYLVCERTALGKAFKAIREDEVLAMALGIDVTRHKLAAFVLSAFFAGLAGAFYAYYTLSVTPHTASVSVTVLAIGMAVLGGSGTIVGALVGAVLLTGITEALRFVGVVYNVIAVGAVLVLLMLFLPGGLLGVVRRNPPRAGRAGTASPVTEQPDHNITATG
jgi:branched-chain amino acid transport system permease protein